MGTMPLPAPDSLWKARSADAWVKAARNYRSMTMDEAMRRVFFLPTFGPFDELHEQADTRHYNLLNTTELGPFARTAIVQTILRGIIDIGEGKRTHGDWRDLTDLWISCTWLRPGRKIVDMEGKDIGEVSPQSLRDRFVKALELWRQGWDFDPTCPNPAVETVCTSPQSLNSIKSDGSGGGSGISSASSEARTKLFYCEEAIPFYWLAQGLLGILHNTPSNAPGWVAFGSPQTHEGLTQVSYREMLRSARLFTRMGEGISAAAAPSVGSVAAVSTSIPSSAELDLGPQIPGQVQLDSDKSQRQQDALGAIDYDYLLGFPSVDILAN